MQVGVCCVSVVVSLCAGHVSHIRTPPMKASKGVCGLSAAVAVAVVAVVTETVDCACSAAAAAACTTGGSSPGEAAALSIWGSGAGFCLCTTRVMGPEHTVRCIATFCEKKSDS